MKPVVGIGLFLLFFAGTCNTPIPPGPWHLDLTLHERDTFYCACDSSIMIKRSLDFLTAGIKTKQDSAVVISTTIGGFRNMRDTEIRFLSPNQLVATTDQKASEHGLPRQLDTGDFRMRHDTLVVVMRNSQQTIKLVHDPVAGTLSRFRFGPSLREIFRQRQ